MRTKRLYRVTATRKHWSDSSRIFTETRDYQSRKAAEHRAALWLGGRPGDDYQGIPAIEPAATVTIQVSEPVAWTSEPVPWTVPAEPEPKVDTSESVF